MSQNPFKRIRKAAGLSIQDFAGLLGVSGVSIALAEKGSLKSPQALLGALASIGHDTEQIIKEYSSWRQELLSSARERLAPQNGR